MTRKRTQEAHPASNEKLTSNFEIASINYCHFHKCPAVTVVEPVFILLFRTFLKTQKRVNLKQKNENWKMNTQVKYCRQIKINADKTILSPLCREIRIYET